MKKVICFVLLFFSFNVGFSQTEEDYIQNIKVYYAKNIKSKACDEVNKGLEKYPTSARIAKLKGLVCSSMKNGSTTGGSTTGGSTTGGSTTGGSTTGGSTTGGSTTGGSKAGGSTTGGTIKEEPVKKPTNININLNMPSQNIFTWNEKLSEISDIKLTIKITSNNLNFTKDVTGFSSYKFSTGNARWDGIPCTVELVIMSADDFVFSGDRKIEVQCACKP